MSEHYIVHVKITRVTTPEREKYKTEPTGDQRNIEDVIVLSQRSGTLSEAVEMANGVLSMAVRAKERAVVDNLPQAAR